MLYPVELRAQSVCLHAPRTRRGRGREIRTPDFLLPKQARCQTAPYPAFFSKPSATPVSKPSATRARSLWRPGLEAFGDPAPPRTRTESATSARAAIIMGRPGSGQTQVPPDEVPLLDAIPGTPAANGGDPALHADRRSEHRPIRSGPGVRRLNAAMFRHNVIRGTAFTPRAGAGADGAGADRGRHPSKGALVTFAVVARATERPRERPVDRAETATRRVSVMAIGHRINGARPTAPIEWGAVPSAVKRDHPAMPRPRRAGATGPP